MGGGSTTPILMALLCLGEPWGRRDWAPLPPGLGPERPGDTGASDGEELLGRGDGLSPGSDPSTQGPDQTWSICVERGGAHGDSLPGLCWRPWDQVQAGESPQHPLLPPNQPLSWGRGAQRVGLMVTRLGGPWGDPWGDRPREKGTLTLQV